MRRGPLWLAALLIAAPAAAQPPPIRFELGQAGRVFWQGELVFGVGRHAPNGAEAIYSGHCAADAAITDGSWRNAMTLHIWVEEDDAARPAGATVSYRFQFEWRRPFDDDPRRLDACGDPGVFGRRSFDTHAGFALAPGESRAIALPDDLLITFRR